MHLLNPEAIIATGGLALIAFIIFAESGLLFGFFFPGDTLLLLAGILSAQGQFSIQLAIFVIVISAIVGGQSGYYIGEKLGPRLFKKQDGILFKKEYVTKSELFYKKHGGKTIILARFIPIIRTFAPVIAGIGSMQAKKFAIYNIVGGVVWGTSITLIGFYFGSKIPNIDKFVLPIVLAVMVFSFGPTLYHIIKDPHIRKTIVKKLLKK